LGRSGEWGGEVVGDIGEEGVPVRVPNLVGGVVEGGVLVGVLDLLFVGVLDLVVVVIGDLDGRGGGRRGRDCVGEWARVLGRGPAGASAAAAAAAGNGKRGGGGGRSCRVVFLVGVGGDD
jgi:hypothetical protein